MLAGSRLLLKSACFTLKGGDSDAGTVRTDGRADEDWTSDAIGNTTQEEKGIKIRESSGMVLGIIGKPSGPGRTLVIPQNHPDNRSERRRRHVPNPVNQGRGESIRHSKEGGLGLQVYGIFFGNRLERGGRRRRRQCLHPD